MFLTFLHGYTFLKLYKWYKIAQSITRNNLLEKPEARHTVTTVNYFLENSETISFWGIKLLKSKFSIFSIFFPIKIMKVRNFFYVWTLASYLSSLRSLWNISTQTSFYQKAKARHFHDDLWPFNPIRVYAPIYFKSLQNTGTLK